MYQQQSQPYENLHHAVRDGAARAVAVVGLSGVALIHLLDLPGKFSEAPYLGWMYIALMIGCVLTASALIGSGHRLAWLAACALPAGAIAGSVLTRTTGLPQATGDIGNWTEPLGLASLFVEGSLVALAGAVLALRPAVVPVPRAASEARTQRAPRAMRSPETIR
ncbi:MAG: hypothetical protein QOD73_1041 [Solirubrobacteraceae bacterium]|nr:hypothetical protein [Solirubrobacteraceae bacterium]